MNNCIKKAYTLAEVLVTIAIVGVLATLTIPNINTSTKNKEREAKFQTIYSQLENALQQNDRIYNCYYVPSDTEINNNFYGLKGATLNTTGNTKECRALYDKIKESLGSTRECTTTACMPSDYLKKAPNVNKCFSNISQVYMLKNGMFITQSTTHSHTFLVDVNGKQPPNAYGKDVFIFAVKLSRATGVPDGKDEKGKDVYKNLPAKVEIFPASPTDTGSTEACDFPIANERSTTAYFNKIFSIKN